MFGVLGVRFGFDLGVVFKGFGGKFGQCDIFLKKGVAGLGE